MTSFRDSQIFLFGTQALVIRNKFRPAIPSTWPKSLPAKTLVTATYRRAVETLRLHAYSACKD
jgi:hypothetical protein